MGQDFLQARSYFLVPLLGIDPDAAHTPAHYQGRIVEASSEPYTDIYVFSHGWHRNLFGAVSAYDRLVSRFTSLFQRGRLEPKSEPYNPLFLALHWHSDPGQDGWIDMSGRRSKFSFLQRAQLLFKPRSGVSDGDYLNTLEDLYEFMTYVSAPDVEALNNPMTATAATLLRQLDRNTDMYGQLSGGPAPRPEDKATLAWRCYQEADAQRVLVDQSVPPQPFGSPLQALSNLLKFAVAVAGLTAVLGLVSRLLHWAPLAGPIGQALSAAGAFCLRGLHALLPGSSFVLAAPVTGIALLLLALAILTGTGWYHQRYDKAKDAHGKNKEKGARGLPVLAVGSWLPLQIALTLPLLVVLFAMFLFRNLFILLAAPLLCGLCLSLHVGVFWPLTFLLAGLVAIGYVQYLRNTPVHGLFSERMESGTLAAQNLRDILARLARWPVHLLKEAVSEDSEALDLADAVDRQLAFWEMQRDGVQAGQKAGEFLDGLFRQMTAKNPAALDGARLHFIGHSFGALVVANAARHLAAVPNPCVPVHSLTLLQAALASDWFQKELWCWDPAKLRGALACVYSSYDSANGFYYPAANCGRLAAGYVGLCGVGDKAECLGKDGLFASLVQPPNLSQHVSGPAPHLLNLDASRLIFAGSIASGGGHDDIYKDDVIHMIWAITAL